MDTNNKDVFAIIMAGGSGKRFWPMSRSKHPKQLLALSGEETLITMAVKRLDKFIPKENVLVFTNKEQVEKTYEELKSTGVKSEKFYGEPMRRDTAACVGYAAAVVRKMDKDGVMMVLPSDHMILPVDKYQEALGRAVLAAKKGYLVTIGVKPKYPATGYGYIQKNNPLKTVENAFTVKAFKEKPDAETAQKFLDSGDYYWNCGIFVWKASEILKAMESIMPKLHKNVEKIAEALGTEKESELIAAEFEKIEPISIDYGLMEKAENVAVVEADFSWDDIGSWTALERHFPHNNAGNVFRGSAFAIETANCTVLCEGNHLVTLIGCRDLIVVHTPDATLVVPKTHAEKVKEMVDKLAEEGRTDVL